MADPTLSLRIETPSVAASLGYFVLGTSQLGGADVLSSAIVYDEKISLGRHVSCARGVSRFDGPTVKADTGTLSALLDNQARTFDPAVSADILPGRRISLRATYNAVTYDIFTGQVHNWQLDYPGQSSTGDAVVTIAANDGMARLAKLNVTENRPEELTGDRIRSVANLIAWPASLRAIDDGVTTMPASGFTVSALSAIQEASDSDMGEAYVEANGHLTFRDRNSIVSDARSMASQATFGDGGGEKKFADITLSFDDAHIRNYFTLTYNEAGDAAVAADSDSIAEFDIYDDQLQVRIADQGTAGSYASFIVGQYAQPAVRVESLTVKPHRDPTNLFPQVLGRKLGDRITVAFQPPGGGARITHECFIRGISHSFTAGAAARDWTTTFVTQDASVWPSVFILGTSLLGSSDTLWW